MVGTSKKLYYYSNVEGKVKAIEQGIHGLSNAFLDTSWPKVDDGKAKLKAAIESDALNNDQLFSILNDSSFAEPDALPQTGVGPELEKILSAKFINTPDYGTVCSTVIKIDRNGTCFFEERTFDAAGKDVARVEFKL